MAGKKSLPFPQGILARIREPGLAQRAVQFFTDKIHQLRLAVDFLRHQQVKLQAAPVYGFMSHDAEDR